MIPKLQLTAIALFTAFCIFNTASAQSGFIYTSPQNGTEHVNPEQRIILKASSRINPSSLAGLPASLKGSKSGEVPYSLQLLDGDEILVIIPERKFALNEQVTLKTGHGLETADGQRIEPLILGFHTKRADNYPLLADFYMEEAALTNDQPGRNSSIENLQPMENNYPVDYPVTTVEQFGDPSPGYFFYTLGGFRTQTYGKYMHILDYKGIPVFYMKGDQSVRDLKILSNGLLAYASSNRQNPALNEYRLMDSAFYHLDTLRMGNGYFVDNHDMKVVDEDRYLMMAYDPQPVDMSQVVPGGDTNAVVTGLVIQIVDTEANVYFQWRSWDHFEITDATDNIDLTKSWVDPVHANAFYIDDDGNILLSSRHMDEITKIDINTGDIIWRFGLGAKKNQFTFLNDTIGFSHQHDIIAMPNQIYTLFDNGNLHEPQFSQAVEYQLDEDALEATLIWNYIDDPVSYGGARGSYRRMENGHRLISWGSFLSPGVTELGPDGSTVVDLHFPDSTIQYRCEKHEWATTRFTTLNDTVDFGEFTGYSPVYNFAEILNPGPDTLRITSTHNHLDDFGAQVNFPVTVLPGESYNLTVKFFPLTNGEFTDILTINSDSESEEKVMRIARQVILTGRTADETPPEAIITPADGDTAIVLNSPVVFEFNEPVFKAGGDTLLAEDLNSIFIFRKDGPDGEDVPFSGMINEQFNVITLAPDDPLAENQHYFVALPEGNIQDEAGNVLDEGQSVTFKTGTEFSISEVPLPEIATLYPNPATEFVTIKSNHEKITGISIFEMDGKLIQTMNTEAQEIRISVTNLSPGIYILRIKVAPGSIGFTRLIVR
jgi:hypothetical protein